MKKSTGTTEAAVSGAESQPDDRIPDDPVKRRTESLRRAQEEEERETAVLAAWVENGSDDLRDARVSVCPVAKDNSVMTFRLTKIIDHIRTGGPVEVFTYGRERDIDLTQKHADIARLYRKGVEQASQINRLTLKKLISALNLEAEVDDVTPVTTQPKKNEKKFIITGIKWNGQQFPAPTGYVYKDSDALGKQLAAEAKKDVPAAMFAGFFKPERNADNMVQSTGLFTLDFDDVQDIGRVLTLIRTDPNVFLCFVSITGSGLKVCVRGPASRNRVEYSDAYVRIAEVKAMQWGLIAEIDRPTKDCSRLCFLSYDPELYVNWDAVPVSLEDLPECNPDAAAIDIPKNVESSAEGARAQADQTAATSEIPLTIDWTETGAIPDTKWENILLSRCLDAMRYIDPCSDREQWRIVGAALKLGYGDDAFDYFDHWSSFGGSQYESREACWGMWQSHKRSAAGESVVTPKSVFKIARKNGWKPASERPDVRTTSDVGTTEAIDCPLAWFRAEFPNVEKAWGDAVTQVADHQGVTHVTGFNEDFLAEAMGRSGSDCPVVFAAKENSFRQYKEGVYALTTEEEVANRLSDLFRKCVRALVSCANLDLSKLITRKQPVLQSTVARAKGRLVVHKDFFLDGSLDYLACANGVLRLSDFELVPFSPELPFMAKLAVPYNPTAKCPEFKETLLEKPLPTEAIDFVQRWSGLLLTGVNLAQKFVILEGTAAGSKGTLARILQGVVGMKNVGMLRPKQLEERFELSRLRSKKLIYGADVPSDFLNSKASRVLKAMTGGDYADFEYKNSNMTGGEVLSLNVLITCNARLRILLDGDTEAWRRRLVLIKYEEEPVAEADRDAHLSERLIKAEGPGILNWMLEGLTRLRTDNWQLFLPDSLKQVRDDLLSASESHVLFVKEGLTQEDHGHGVTSSEAFDAYVKFCTMRNWSPLAKTVFDRRIGDVVAQVFGKNRVNCIPRRGKDCTGWTGLALAPDLNTGLEAFRDD